MLRAIAFLWIIVALAEIAFGSDVAPSVAGKWPIHMRGGNSAAIVDGARLYFSVGRDFVAADFSDPTRPRPLGAYNGITTVAAAAASGNIAYIAETPTQRLRVVDFSNPAAPQLLATYLAPSSIRHVTLSGNLLYLATLTGVTVLDVTVASNPVLYSQTTGAASRVAAIGTLCFAGGSGVRVIDFSNPSLPRVLKALLTSINVTDVFVDSNRLYVGTFTGQQIFDISNPSSPTTLGNAAATQINTAAGDRLLVSDTMSVTCYNVANPALPQLINSLPLRGAQSLAISGNRAIVGTLNGLHILDLPAAGPISEIGSYSTDGNAASMSRSGNFILVADGVAGLRIIDASDPRAPKLAATFSQPGIDAKDVTVQETTAYLTTTSEFLFVDFKDAASPRLLGSWPATSPLTFVALGNVGYASTSGNDLEILDLTDPTAPKHLGAVTGAKNIVKLKIGDRYGIGCNSVDGPFIIDFSNPQQPSAVKQSFVALDAEIVGDQAFFIGGGALNRLDLSSPTAPVQVIGASGGIARDGNRLVAVSTRGVFAVDVANPKAPTLIGSFPQPTGAATLTAAALLGNFAIAAAGTENVLFLDLTPRANPQTLGRTVSGAPVRVDAQGNRMAATVGQNLQIYDITTLSEPRQASSIAVAASGSTAGGVAIAGNYAYVGAAAEGIKTINISDAIHPVSVRTNDTPGLPRALRVAGTRLYVADNTSLQIFDISIPDNPRAIDQFSTHAQNVRVIGNNAFVSAQDLGLQIVDVTSGANPTLIGSYNTSGAAYDVAVIGNVAIVADSLSAPILDISNQQAPVRIRSLPYLAQCVVAAGNYLYMSDDTPTLRVFDVTDPSNPTPVGGNGAFQGITDVQWRDGHLLVGATWPGISILSPYGPLPPEFLFMRPTIIGTNIRLRIEGTAGANLQIQRSNPLGAWENWTPVTLNNGAIEFEDTGALARGAAFYRATASAP